MRNSRPGNAHRGRMRFTLLVMLLVLSVVLPTTAWAAPAQSRGGETITARVYVVGRGDTLSAIALMFGVSQEAIMQANMLRNPNHIYVGQQLIIPESRGGGMGGPSCADYHTVRRGETLSEIALWYGVDSYALARANGIYDLNDIYVGQKLCIPGSMGGKPMEPQRPMEPQKPMQPQPRMDMPAEPQRPSGGMMPMEPQRPGGGMQPMQPQRPMGDMPMGPQHPQDKGREPLRPTEYWKGMYFTDKYFSEFAFERQDLEVNFNWFTGSPFGNSNENRFSVRWEKNEYFKGGHYRFNATADDGVRVYVDDQLIIDGWKIQPATDYKAELYLHEGVHKLVVEYYEEAEDALIRVNWEPIHRKR